MAKYKEINLIFQNEWRRVVKRGKEEELVLDGQDCECDAGMAPSGEGREIAV